MWKAKKVFGLQLYDTYNMVQFLPVPETERQGLEFFEKLEQIHDESREKRKNGKIQLSAEAI
jgi:hypothetical protein